MKRVLGLDYGSKTVGVAVSDALLITAQPKETICRDRESKLRRTLVRIEELVSEYDVGLIVIGLPLNMDDSVGERAEAAMAFRDRLERRLSLPAVLSDERLTTVESDALLQEMGIPPQERKRYIDQIAACLILREYMENHRDTVRRYCAEADPGRDGEA